MAKVLSRMEALALAEDMLRAAPANTRREYQSGYFDGLVAGWHQCNLITEAEMKDLRKRMAATRPAWWNLAARLGL